MGTIIILHSAAVDDRTNICFRFGKREPPHTGGHVTQKSVPAQSPRSVLPNPRAALSLSSGLQGCVGGMSFVELGPVESRGPGVSITFTREDTARCVCRPRERNWPAVSGD